MNLGLTNKVAIVTGGSHGIGRAIASNLVQEGCRVVICGRNEQRLKSTTRDIETSGNMVFPFVVDVMDDSQIKAFIDAVIQKWKHIDILVNNVGGGGRWGKPEPELTPIETWREVYQKNAETAIKFTMLVLPYMKANKWGRVVTIASIYGREGGGRPWFNMAKAAEISLMKTLAMNPGYTRLNITFNSVAPGGIMISDTGWGKMQNEQPEEYAKWCEGLPMGRLGKPEEVASVVTFLCSERASFINGACVPIDGAESRSF